MFYIVPLVWRNGLDLDSGMKGKPSLPARLPQQPIFYPVLQLEYGRQPQDSHTMRCGKAML